MESFADLFGRMRSALPKGKVLSERAELVKWLCEKLKKEPKVIGIRVAHLSLDHLYVIQSEYKDISRRRGVEAARKFLWAITRTRTIHENNDSKHIANN